MRLLEVRQGQFGEIRVVDWPRWRKLIGAGAAYGSSYLEPSATELYPQARPGPGPVMQLDCQVAWLMAGVQHPAGHGLMLGLGSGSGAVGLLHCFPRLHLEVVEIDSTMISIARAHFPLVPFFEKKERLRIAISDAEQYLRANRTKYDFILVDLFTGPKMPSLVVSRPFLNFVIAASSDVWFNTIESLDRALLHRLLDTLDQIGQSARYLFSPVPLNAWVPMLRNWIITTANVDFAQLHGFTPFEDLAGEAPSTTREIFRRLIANQMTRAQAFKHAERQGIIRS